MKSFPPPLDLTAIRALPLAQRRSLSALQEVLAAAQRPRHCPPDLARHIGSCAAAVRAARHRGAGVLLLYGAHLVKNGLQPCIIELLRHGWITHLATNGAGTIHDWEFAYLGRSEESVRANVATGTFGTWDETSRYLHLSLLAGALRAEGYGRSLGRLMIEESVTLPTPAKLSAEIQSAPSHPLTPARAELLHFIQQHQQAAGVITVPHPHKEHSIVAQAFAAAVPLTVHPGIGYDIIANHPMFNGAAIGRAAQLDFAQLAAAVNELDGGVVLNVGTAIMGPQVFEKSISCVNHLRLAASRPIVRDHQIFVVDIQDGGRWDWTQGEPPKSHPAYYLRFCKSFARMGGATHYLECDNVAFFQQLHAALK